MGDKRKLYIDLEAGQSVKIGEASVQLTNKSGRKSRLQITADRSIPVTRDDGSGGNAP